MSFEKSSGYAPKTVRIFRILWAATLVVVVTGSLLPNAGPPDAGVGLDKLLHFGLYGLLTFIPLLLFESRKTALLLAMAVSPLGSLLELAQTQVDGRTFSAGDLLANNVGVVVGLLLGILFRLKRHYRAQVSANLSNGETLSDRE